MTKTIEIKFFNQPKEGESFSYVIRINGDIIDYPGGLFSVNKVFSNTLGYPTGVALGANLAATINSTLTNLNTVNSHPGISYAIDGNSILVTVEYTGTFLLESVTYTPRLHVYAPGDVLFEQDIEPGKLRKAYNNDIVKIYSSISNPSYCDIETTGFKARLYPDPQERFYFNFRPFVSALINTRNFEDRLVPAITDGNAETFIYNATEGTYISMDVSFKIGHINGGVDTVTHNLAWFAGVEQAGDYTTFLRSGCYVLTPFKKDTANHYYIKYWEGYPFDINIYYAENVMYLKNQTTLLSQEFNLPGKISRLVLSDGRTDETLESLLPLTDGYNKLRLMAAATDSETDKFITLEKIPYTCGVYLKWLNKYGGYSYWLFENTYSADRNTKQLGELASDNYNLEDTFTRAIQIGKESQDTIKVIAELLNEEERNIVEGLLESPKIYLFTGSPFSQNSYRNWIEVSLKTTGARLKNARQPLTNFTFDVELPQRYTQTL